MKTGTAHVSFQVERLPMTHETYLVKSFTKYQVHPSGDHGKTSLVVAQIASRLRTAVIRIPSGARAQMISTPERVRVGAARFRIQKKGL